MAKKVKEKSPYRMRDVFKTLLKSVRQYKKESILAALLIMVESLLECFLPFVMSMLLNTMSNVNKNEILTQVLIYAAILIVLAMASFGCGVAAGRISAKASVGFGTNLRHDLFIKTTTYSFENIDKFSISSLVTRQNTDVWFIQMSYMMMIRIALRAPTMLIFSIVMASINAPQMSWVYAITIPVLAGGLLTIASIAMPIFTKMFKRYDDVNESIEENVRGIRVVKTYVREEYEKEKFKNRSDELRKGFTKAERVVALQNPIMSSCMYLSMALVIFFGSNLILNTATVDTSSGEAVVMFGAFKVGEMSSLLTYGAQILMSLLMFSFFMVMFTMSAASMRRCYEVLAEESTIKNCDNPVYEMKDGSIIFNNVNFKYSKNAQKFALSNVNLNIKSGETIGIIGATGSSKSTLVNLISRFYDTTDGEILVGGVNVKDYDLTTLRNGISMVLQNNVLFSGTIKDNMRWGNKNATDEEIIEACKIAQADSFVQTFPDKYDTMILQGGTNVSGGQKQRLCIARAIIKNPKILILDDSTSAVDTRTDALIREGMRNTLPNTTKIIISQRLNSVENADKIIVMDDGKINDIGTHEELLSRNVIYKDIYEIQNRVGGGENEKE